MFARVLHILLIAMLLICPTVCGQGMCRCALGGDAVSDRDDAPETCANRQCGDTCRQNSQPREPVPAPVQPCQDPCEDCQCICGGATVEEAPQVLLLLTLVQPPDVWTIDASAEFPSPWPYAFAVPGMDEASGALSGRSIRCRHMSFLC